jgi:hypothetical protein
MPTKKTTIKDTLINQPTKTRAKSTATASTGGALATRALKAAERQPNDVKTPLTASYPKSYTLPLTTQKVDYPEIEAKLKITTCSNPDTEALHYDDVLEHGVKYKVREDFQCVYDASGQVPQWRPMNENLRPEDAVYRTTEESQIVEGYHKGPNTIAYSMADNDAISRGGLIGDPNHYPSYKSPGKFPGFAEHAPYLNRGA